MRKTFTLFLFILLIISLKRTANAQCNPTPCDIPVPQVNAMDACVLPRPQSLDCYYGQTTPDAPVSFPPSWCTVINNNHFFAFIADAAIATFSISCFGCASGNGIQAAVLSTADCANFEFESPCLGNIQTQTTQILTATGLIPGEVYYLCIDGSGGALCDYAINGSVPTVNGPTSGCIPSPQGSTYSTTALSSWTISPPGAGVILGNPVATTVTVSWKEPGPAQICAQSVNCPNAPEDCIDVIIGEDTETTEEVDVCQGKTVTCAGKTFSTGGTFNVTLPSYLNCDSIIKCVVNLIPKVYTTETVLMCQGQSATCAGVDFFGPGSYPVTLQGDNGCDSIVTCKVNLIPTTVSPFYQVNLCGPAEYYMCDNVLTTSGIYTEICTSSQGCDSIVNVNLAILEPVVVIAKPDTLDCNANAIITIDGSGSSQNTAVGGTTQYKWTGPGIVGFGNQSTVQVNQPGNYCLVMTHGRGGVYCSDTACVSVSAISAVPQLPLISGASTPCAGSTQVYTATSVGNPPPTSFNWTTPNGVPFTPLSQNTIQITWSSPADSGQLCVTANNTCGASSPACLPISVQPALITPQMAGPATVCAGGGNYLFTLNVQQPGATYTWTVPSGAALSGGGDTVSVNFLNSASGQVCVTAQNGCGTATPVCTNVQVSPIPTADLASNSEICAGESVNLTFTLSGSGPFDVTWNDGTTNSVLNNIISGHTIPVSPAQTTKYRLLSVADNTVPAACTTTLNDSVTVTVWQHAGLSQTAQICEGETILLGGAQQNTSGVYVDSLNTVHGCDSVITTTLTVYDIDSLTLNLTTCDPAAAGTSTIVFNQTNGCDSVVTTNVTLLPSDTTLIFDKSCDLNNVGVFTQNLTNVYGCDSTVVTTVTFSLSDTTLLSDTSCDPAATGVFTQNLITVDGCDSLVITTVSLLPSNTTNLTGLSCNPANVGVFTQNLTNQYGCDSTVITTISFFHTDTTFLTAQNCDPAATGVFTEILVTSQGCDSVIVTTVSLLPSNTTNLTGSSCNPADVGVFTQNLTNQYGCDSTVITTVSFFHTDTTYLTAQDCDPAATGVFAQTLVTPQGCDSVIITTVTLLPSNTTNLTGSSCNPANVGVFTQNLTNQYGCDSTVITTVSFFHTDTTYLTAQDCDPAATGVFTQTLVTPEGCDSVVITTVSLLPSDQVAIESSTCDPSAAGVFTYNLVNKYGCDSTVTETVLLLPSNTTNLAFSTCDPAQVGTVTTVLPNQWGCDSTVVSVTSLLPPSSCGVTATLTGSSIPCGSTTGSLTLTATLGETPFSYTILLGGSSVATGTIDAVGVPQTVSGLAAGNYTLNISSVNGFSTTAQAAIVQLVPPVVTAAVVSNYNGYAVSCTGDTDGSAGVIATGGLAPYSFAWSNGGNTQQINNIGVGNYSVTVTDANNCTSTAGVALDEPTPLNFTFTVNDLDCFGQNDGAIFVEPTGGVSPYRYSLDNINFQNTNVFYNLNSGIYTVTTLDANDCQRMETILINAAIPLVVNLGGNQTIEQGGSTVIEAIVNVPQDSIMSVVWTPPFDSSECPQCLTQTVAPLVSTTYSVHVTALNGCDDEDKIVVIVDRRRHIFIPNVFSPNGDGENDIVSVFAKPGTVRSIKSFQIFDRWGEVVFTLDNFAPNDPTLGWDGRLNGQPMNPGVFVWYIEVEFIDGVVELYEGDVTIIR